MTYPRVIHDSGKRYSREQHEAAKADLRAKGIPFKEGPWGIRVDVEQTRDDIKASDATWFEDNPRRSYRIREALPDEMSESRVAEAALEGNGPMPQPGDRHFIIVKQVQPGFRIRKSITIPVQFADWRVILPDDTDRVLAKVFRAYWLAIDGASCSVEIMPGSPRYRAQPAQIEQPTAPHPSDDDLRSTCDPMVCGDTALRLENVRRMMLGDAPWLAGEWAAFVFDTYPASGADFGRQLVAAGAFALPATRCYFQFWQRAVSGRDFVVCLFVEQIEAGQFRIARADDYGDSVIAHQPTRAALTDVIMQDVIACVGALAIRGVERREIRPPRLALNARRADRRAHDRTPKTPPFTVIHLAERQQAQGTREGSHTPKRPHFRRGHVRRLQSGRVIGVSPCFINAEGVPLPEYRVIH